MDRASRGKKHKAKRGGAVGAKKKVDKVREGGETLYDKRRRNQPKNWSEESMRST